MVARIKDIAGQCTGDVFCVVIFTPIIISSNITIIITVCSSRAREDR
jgi:hypothetical protein